MALLSMHRKYSGRTAKLTGSNPLIIFII